MYSPTNDTQMGEMKRESDRSRGREKKDAQNRERVEWLILVSPVSFISFICIQFIDCILCIISQAENLSCA